MILPDSCVVQNEKKYSSWNDHDVQRTKLILWNNEKIYCKICDLKFYSQIHHEIVLSRYRTLRNFTYSTAISTSLCLRMNPLCFSEFCVSLCHWTKTLTVSLQASFSTFSWIISSLNAWIVLVLTSILKERKNLYKTIITDNNNNLQINVIKSQIHQK